MADPLPELSLYGMASRLLGCAQVSLAASLAGSPERASVVSGAQIAWDTCDCGGQLTVHTARVFPSDAFPVQKQEPPYRRCKAKLVVVEYVVTILRCVPVQDDAGTPPPVSAMDHAAQVDASDREAVLSAVSCCLEDLDDRLPKFMLMTEQLPVGDQGMCAGSETHVLVGLPNCWGSC